MTCVCGRGRYVYFSFYLGGHTVLQASLRSTLLAVAAEVGLDAVAAGSFLDSDELKDHVRK